MCRWRRRRRGFRSGASEAGRGGVRGEDAAAVEKADSRLGGQSGDSHVTVTRREQKALVIGRGIGGRLRVIAAGRNWWTERHDAVSLAHLRATGCVAASARAAGFTPKSAWNRRDRLPGFAPAMDEAREDADLALEFQLSVEAERGRGTIIARKESRASTPTRRCGLSASARTGGGGSTRRRGRSRPRSRR
jgi:hypothetical protein